MTPSKDTQPAGLGPQQDVLETEEENSTALAPISTGCSLLGVKATDFQEISPRMECSGKKPKISKLPKEAVLVLQDWLIQHHRNPYPTIVDKEQLATSTNLTVKQVTDWFNRTRSRKLGKPAKIQVNDSIGYLESLLSELDNR